MFTTLPGPRDYATVLCTTDTTDVMTLTENFMTIFFFFHDRLTITVHGEMREEQNMGKRASRVRGKHV